MGERSPWGRARCDRRLAGKAGLAQKRVDAFSRQAVAQGPRVGRVAGQQLKLGSIVGLETFEEIQDRKAISAGYPGDALV